MSENIEISKSQRKRDMHALQELGETLVVLPAETLARLDLPEPLRVAVGDARRMRQRGARRRQLQYIGRLMRDVDVRAIRGQLELFENGSATDTAILHRSERWRERMLSDDGAVREFVSENHRLDVQKLRTLLRNCRRETASGKPPRASRELFRMIRESLIEQERTRDLHGTNAAPAANVNDN